MLTNDCRVMLNSSSKFRSLGEREDFLSSVSQVLLQQKLFQEKSQTIKLVSVNENKCLKSVTHPHENSSLLFALCFADA